MNKYEPSSKSPYWGSTTKIVVGVAVVAAIGALVFYLRPIIGPLLLAFVLTYLVYPIVERVHRTAHLPWGVSVNIVYLLLIIFLIAFFAASGVALVQQIQSLFNIINTFLNDLPKVISALPGNTLNIAGYKLNLDHMDAQSFSQQILDNASLMLGQTGSMLGTVASQTASFVGWLFFVLLVSYFILVEARNTPQEGTSPSLEFPGYNYDFYRLSKELARTWNAFLRGQIIVVIITFLVTSLLFSVLGVKYALALGLLAGLGRFVPYLGQFTYMVITGFVCFFQPENYFGLNPEMYTVLVLVCALVLDTILDNLVAVRIYGRSLGLHPAAILITALIGARMIGFTGLVLAAPVLATLRLLGRYITRKMFNIDPWLEPDVDLPPMEYPWISALNKIRHWLKI